MHWDRMMQIKGIWALDPIDGTAGFLRGAQYAVCLALMVDGKVVVGVLGCPNLPVDPSNPSGEKGVLLSAVRGGGATIVTPPLLTLLQITQILIILTSSIAPAFQPRTRNKNLNVNCDGSDSIKLLRRRRKGPFITLCPSLYRQKSGHHGAVSADGLASQIRVDFQGRRRDLPEIAHIDGV